MNNQRKAVTVVPSVGTRAGLAHDRTMYRLRIAKWVMIIGIVGIILLTMSQLFTPIIDEQRADLVQNAIYTLASITMLALGYIAGSNIESGGRD